MKLLITGASGFIGSALVEYFSKKAELELVGTVRNMGKLPIKNIEFRIWDINNVHNIPSDLNLSDIDIIVHTAGLAHITDDASGNLRNEFQRINTVGTLELAKHAAKCGTKRFLFMSSVKAGGDNTDSGIPFSTKNMGQPTDAYGLSKYEAETGLLKFSETSPMEVTILRLPLVYGPGVKGNFNTLVKILKTRVPLPLGLLKNNRRSMIGIDNLISLLDICLDHPNAANKLFFVSDNRDLSTFQLLVVLGHAIEKPAILFNFPIKLLNLLANIIGAGAIEKRLTGSLQVDISETLSQLQWEPPFSIETNFEKLK